MYRSVLLALRHPIIWHTLVLFGRICLFFSLSLSRSSFNDTHFLSSIFQVRSLKQSLSSWLSGSFCTGQRRHLQHVQHQKVRVASLFLCCFLWTYVNARRKMSQTSRADHLERLMQQIPKWHLSHRLYFQIWFRVWKEDEDRADFRSEMRPFLDCRSIHNCLTLCSNISSTFKRSAYHVLLLVTKRKVIVMCLLNGNLFECYCLYMTLSKSSCCNTIL